MTSQTKLAEYRKSPCWIYPAYTSGGYARRKIKGKNVLLHRAVYEAVLGKIPDGLQIDHLCRNRACVNPYHLEPVTVGENVRRGEGISAKNARKTHCKRGHEFTPENIYAHQGKGRRCKICVEIHRANYLARLKNKQHGNNT